VFAGKPCYRNPRDSHPQLRETLGRPLRRIAFSFLLPKPSSPQRRLDSQSRRSAETFPYRGCVNAYRGPGSCGTTLARISRSAREVSGPWAAWWVAGREVRDRSPPDRVKLRRLREFSAERPREFQKLGVLYQALARCPETSTGFHIPIRLLPRHGPLEGAIVLAAERMPRYSEFNICLILYPSKFCINVT